jgi:hypothetical protein
MIDISSLEMVMAVGPDVGEVDDTHQNESNAQLTREKLSWLIPPTYLTDMQAIV